MMEQHLGTGRRKTAVARVYVRSGRGRILVNHQPVENYFAKRPLMDDIIREPLRDTHTASKYDVVVNVRGGGFKAQAEAIRHGIARALNNANPAYRPILKGNGLLTRDPRQKERKKYGQPKARKRGQFSKR